MSREYFYEVNNVPEKFSYFFQTPPQVAQFSEEIKLNTIAKTICQLLSNCNWKTKNAEILFQKVPYKKRFSPLSISGDSFQLYFSRPKNNYTPLEYVAVANAEIFLSNSAEVPNIFTFNGQESKNVNYRDTISSVQENWKELTEGFSSDDDNEKKWFDMLCEDLGFQALIRLDYESRPFLILLNPQPEQPFELIINKNNRDSNITEKTIEVISGHLPEIIGIFIKILKEMIADLKKSLPLPYSPPLRVTVIPYTGISKVTGQIMLGKPYLSSTPLVDLNQLQELSGEGDLQ